MSKQKLLKVLLIFTGVMMISAMGYTAWRVNKNIDKVALKINHPSSPQKESEREIQSDKANINTSNWVIYENKKYHYTIRYPKGTVVSLDRTISSDVADNISIALDTEKLAMRICVADNSKRISSIEFLNLLTNISRSDYPPSLCGTFQDNILSLSETTIDGVLGYQAKIFSYDSNELCYFVATKKVMLAVCIPEEDPTEPLWRERLKLYTEIFSTIKIPK